MLKKITCIECPTGCQLEVDAEGGYVVKVTGNKCEKGEAYARQEIENPMRILTSTVMAQGLGLKMVPVRTNKPIPKAKLIKAMEEIKKIRLDKPVKTGEAVQNNFLGLAVDLIATREVSILPG